MPRTILILSSMPRDMAPLRVHEEVREIEDAIRRARYRDEYQVVARLGIRARDVHRVLIEHRPTIVHFSGHGRGEQGMVLEDERGDSLLVSGMDFSRMLGHFRDAIKCVLINACQSEAQIDDMAEHIPFVIGMKQSLDDRAAISFSAAFYECLANGASISFAYDVACSAVSLNNLAVERIAILACNRPVSAGEVFPNKDGRQSKHTRHSQELVRLWDVNADAGTAGTVPASIEANDASATMPPSRRVPPLLHEIVRATPEAMPPATRRGRLWEVPELPPHYLARSVELEQLEQVLMQPSGGTVGITALGQRSQPGADKHGLYGMGGIGKSVLAAAIARRPAIRERFPDGIIWLGLGQTPKLALLQAQLCRALDYSETFDTIGEGTLRLREIVAGQAILLVLDDVWDAAHAQALDVVGSHGRVLVTTRDVEVLTWLDAREYSLDVLNSTQALSLLADWIQVDRDALPPAAVEVSRSCGYLPLALAMIGALVRRGRTWVEVQTWLNEAQIVRIQGKVPAYPYRNVLQTVDASVTALAAEHEHARCCYIDLAVFPEDTPIPRSALRVLWSRHGLHTADADALADTLCDRALARRDEAERIVLHDLQRLYARSHVQDLANLHSAFAHAYVARCHAARSANREGNYAGFNDRYFFQRLPWHLAEAGRYDELAEILFDFDWMDAKLHVAGVTELLADFELLPGEHTASDEARLVRDALRMSSPALAGDLNQLPSQLVGRLGRLDQESPGSYQGIVRLLDQTRRTARYPWLRVRVASLTAPGGPEILTLHHGASVNAVAVTPDGKRAISASRDNTFSLWDLNAGSKILTITCHDPVTRAVAVTSDGKRAVSVSAYGTFTVWDIATGSVILTAGNHQLGMVGAVAMTPDGSRDVFALSNQRLMLWDLNAGWTFRTLTTSTSPVQALAVTPDGKRAVSTLDDGTLKLWDLDLGTELVDLVDGYDSPILAVVITPDGKRVVTASKNRRVNLWDLDTGTVIRSLYPSRRFKLKAVTPDGKCAISALSDGPLWLWDLDRGGCTILTLEGHTDDVEAVAVTSDGKRAISASNDGTLKLWNLDSRCKRLALDSHDSRVWAVAVTSDGKCVVSASKDRTLKLWDSTSGSVLFTLEGHNSDVCAVAVTPDGKRAVSASMDRTLKLWDLDSGSEILTLEGHAFDVLAVAVTPDGKRAVSASVDRTLKLWDLDSGSEILTLEGHQLWVTAVAETSDGGCVVSVADDRTFKLWDLHSGSEVVNLPRYSLAAAMSVDGKRFLSVSFRGICKVWNLDSSSEMVTIAHGSLTRAVTVSADGKRAVYTLGGQSLKIRDADVGRPLATFTGDGPVTACAVSANRHLFVAGDKLGRIHFLELIEPDPGTAAIDAHAVQADALNISLRVAPVAAGRLSSRATGQPGSLPGAHLLTRSGRNQLVGLLEACRALQETLIGDNEFNKRFVHAIDQPVESASRLRSYLSNIVSICTAVPNGLAALREAVFWLEGDTIPMQQVDAFLQRLGINLGSLP